MATPIPRQRTPLLDLLRARHAGEWDIYQTTEGWHAVRCDGRPGLQVLSAHTARGLLADLAHVEEATG